MAPLHKLLDGTFTQINIGLSLCILGLNFSVYIYYFHGVLVFIGIANIQWI